MKLCTECNRGFSPGNTIYIFEDGKELCHDCIDLQWGDLNELEGENVTVKEV